MTRAELITLLQSGKAEIKGESTTKKGDLYVQVKIEQKHLSGFGGPAKPGNPIKGKIEPPVDAANWATKLPERAAELGLTKEDLEALNT